MLGNIRFQSCKRYGKFCGKVCDSELWITASSTFAFDFPQNNYMEFPTEAEATDYIREQGDEYHE